MLLEAANPPRVARLAVAAAIGIVAGVYCYLRLIGLPYAAQDFTYPWFAAQRLLAGDNPYVAARTTTVLPFPKYFPYPLTAAIAAIPFAPIPMYAAGGIFFGLSAAAMAYAVTRDGWWRLALCATAPFAVAAWSVQWSPMIIAATLLSPLGWLLAAKPNIGLGAFAYRPRVSTAIGVTVFALLSLVVMPSWPSHWLQAVHDAPNHTAPLFWPFGAVGLLALIRWREPEARLVAALTVIPAVPWFYDQLLFMLVARRLRELAILSACSWIALIAALARYGMTFEPGMRNMQPFVVMGTIIPATLLVLWHGRARARERDP